MGYPWGPIIRGLQYPFPITQTPQYPLIEEYGLNYIGLHIMIEAIFLN